MEILNKFCGILLDFFTTHIRAILIVVILVTLLWLLTRKPRGIPPGPRWTLPLLGDMLSIRQASDGDDVRLPFRRLRKKYGDIYSVYMGPRLTVVVNGYDDIKELLVKNGEMFSDRPPTFLNDFLNKGRGIVGSSGVVWKEQRKFAVETLRDFGVGKAILEDKIHAELEILIHEIRKHRGEKFNFFSTIQYAVGNIIASIVFGKRFEYDDPVFNGYIQRLNDTSASFSGAALVNFLPALRFLPGDMFNIKRLNSNKEKGISTLLKPAVEGQKNNYNEFHTSDYISSYLKEMKRMKKFGQPTTLNEDNLIASIGDLFTAGTETTSSTIIWTILYLLHHPRIHEKCFHEVRDAIGYGRLPSIKDKPNMPFMEAVIMESSRLANIANLGIPHSTSSDVHFKGYLIPKHTVIIGNLDSVLSDDKEWGDAGRFRPERFLDKHGKLMRREEWIPFSMGRRNCLGESLAKMELFLFLTTLIQRFEIKIAADTQLPSLKGKFGITHAPNYYEVQAVPR